MRRVPGAAGREGRGSGSGELGDECERGMRSLSQLVRDADERFGVLTVVQYSSSLVSGY